MGRDIIDTARQQLIKTNPWVVNSQLSVVEQNGLSSFRTLPGPSHPLR
ncbi:internal (core) protein [Enterobacter phage 01_vB_Eclo_IJM]|nr:internal (core) protein [Enterobacter phage 01_vB_Eclo_IJM]